jgi:hypothetical protein
MQIGPAWDTKIYISANSNSLELAGEMFCMCVFEGRVLCSVSWIRVEADFVAPLKFPMCATKLQSEIIIWVFLYYAVNFKAYNCALERLLILSVIEYSSVKLNLKFSSHQVMYFFQSAAQAVQVARCTQFGNIY